MMIVSGVLIFCLVILACYIVRHFVFALNRLFVSTACALHRLRSFSFANGDGVGASTQRRTSDRRLLGGVVTPRLSARKISNHSLQ